MLAQHDKFLSSSVLPIPHDKLRFSITEKRSSTWVTCMTDLRAMPDKHDKHEFFQTQTLLHLIVAMVLCKTVDELFFTDEIYLQGGTH